MKLLHATLQYYRNAARQEPNPVIKAHYKKQIKLMRQQLQRRLTNNK